MTELHHLSTSHGAIVVEEAGYGDMPVLLMHGNSLSREVFRQQLGGALARKYCLIAFDLPGHGDSGDALNASRTYTRPGLADAAIEVLDPLGLKEVVVVGWSLGGHIALEMAPRFSGIKGLLICGAPPVSRRDMAAGFIPTPHMRLAGQQYLGPTEIDAFGETIFGTPVPGGFRRAIERADGLARKTIFQAARSGAGTDQRWIVENCPVPLAVVVGSEDPLMVSTCPMRARSSVLTSRLTTKPGWGPRARGRSSRQSRPAFAQMGESSLPSCRGVRSPH